MTLAQQIVDRAGATPGTNVVRANLGPLVVADSFVKSGSLSSTAGLVITYSALIVVVNPASGAPAVEVLKSSGTYTITGAANTDNYVYLSITGVFSQQSVSHGSAAPSVPANTVCLWMVTTNGGGTAFTSTTNVAPTAAQLLASSVAALASTVIPGFTWDSTKSVADQMAALAAAVSSSMLDDGSNAVNPVFPGDVTVSRHLFSVGTAPTFNSVASGFSSVSIVGNDISGQIFFTISLSVTAGIPVNVMNVVFHLGYGGAQPHVQLNPDSPSTFLPACHPTNSGFSLTVMFFSTGIQSFSGSIHYSVVASS